MVDEFEAAADQATTAVAEVEPPGPSAPKEPEAKAEPPKPADKPSEPDPKDARITALEQEVQVAKSQAGGRRTANERQNELMDKFESLSKTVTAFMSRNVSEDDKPALAKELDEIAADDTTQAATRTFDNNLEAATVMLSNALKTSGLDTKGSELTETRDTWNKAKQDGDSAGLYKAVALANQAVALAERKKITDAAFKPASEEKPNESASAMEMASTGGGSAASISDRELIKKVNAEGLPITQEVKDAFARIGAPLPS